MQKLMRPRGAFEYVPNDDKKLPPEQQTVIVLRPLTQIERMQAYDAASWVSQDADGTRRLQKRTFELARELCLSHIIEVRNFPSREPIYGEAPDAESPAPITGYGPDRGQPWPRDDAARVEYLDQFDDFVVLEIGNELRDRSALSEDEVKA